MIEFVPRMEKRLELFVRNFKKYFKNMIICTIMGANFHMWSIPVDLLIRKKILLNLLRLRDATSEGSQGPRCQRSKFSLVVR